MTEAPWLDEVPESWEVRRFAWLGRWTGGGTPSKSEPSYWNGAIPWVSPKDMKVRLIRDTMDHVSQAGVRASSTRLVPAGSVLIVTRSGILRHSLPVGITERPMAINQDLKALQPVPDVNAAFVAYWIEANQNALLSLWRKEGTTVESLETDLIRETPLPLPPLDQQRDIASFLDRECARIDTLIEKKRRLLDLLEEKRTALITRAVTRGLDPDVPVKDSGVEWIGEIPEHWEVVPLYTRFKVALGKMLDSKRITGDHLAPYLRNQDVQWKTVNVDDLPLMDFGPGDRVRYALREGDLLVCEGGDVGRCAVWEAPIDECYYQKALHRVRPRRNDSNRFLFYLMWAAAHMGVFEAGGNPNTIIHLTAVMLRQQRLPLPGPSEQEQIADVLERQWKRTEELRRRIEQAASLLQEYRTALISAAVTGKIDVAEPVLARARG